MMATLMASFQINHFHSLKPKFICKTDESTCPIGLSCNYLLTECGRSLLIVCNCSNNSSHQHHYFSLCFCIFCCYCSFFILFLNSLRSPGSVELLCSPKWPQPQGNPPSSSSQVLHLQELDLLGSASLFIVYLY